MAAAEAAQTEDAKEILKELRKGRKETIHAVAAMVKEQKRIRQAITRVLGDGPLTVPEIARRTGIAPDQVLWWVASMKKYGAVVEDAKEGSYFRYRLSK